MLQDRFRKKTNRPGGGNNSSLETVDITDQVPQVDDVLAEVDKALEKAAQIERSARGHWVECCGTRTWVGG